MKYKEISVEEAAALKKAVFIDVREQSERDAVYIPNSLHIPLSKLKHENPPLQPRRAGTKILKYENTIVIYCASGCRSATAAQALSDAGHKNIYSLKGGIAAWQKAGQCIITGKMQRYARQIILPEIGMNGQKKLLQSKALIIGAGGLGSPAAMYLAAAGIGTIGIVDSDRVELDNLHRQIIHTTKSVGVQKTKSAAQTILALNPDVKVKLFAERLDKKNAVDIFKGFDVVLDGSDNFPTRYVVNGTCVKLKIPLVHGSILRFTGQVSVFDVKDGGPCYACVYPEPPPPDVAPSCVEAGVLGTITGIIGTMQAMEALKLIANFGEPLKGKLLIFDALMCKMRTLELKKDEKCKVCNTRLL